MLIRERLVLYHFAIDGSGSVDFQEVNNARNVNLCLGMERDKLNEALSASVLTSDSQQRHSVSLTCGYPCILRLNLSTL